MAERICPTCGQPWPEVSPSAIRTADALVNAMRIRPPKPAHPKLGWDRYRNIYEGADKTGKRGCGRYFLTYGGGEATYSAIAEALKRGLIEPITPGINYWRLVP